MKRLWIVALVAAGLLPPAQGSAADTDERVRAGGSLFDQVFAKRTNGALVYDIPFPFSALTGRLADRLEADDDTSSPLLQVLIPLGRSLQRDAAAPDFFQLPRVIVAVGRDTDARDTALVLKDRLYLGYQAQAETIEIISYNPSRGRFEFQVVEDYAPGATPSVSYASRSLCMECHQNGGPIWSDPPWDETNASPKIAERLGKHGAHVQGVAVGTGAQGADASFRIAASIDRANLFVPHQQLWRAACGASTRCRGDLLAAMLQYRLSGNRGFAPMPQHSTNIFRAGWRNRWPAGLKLPSSRIANRDPLSGESDIAGEVDPLEPRPPVDVLKASDADALASVIAGLAEFLPMREVRSLDRRLFVHRPKTGADRRRLETACAFTQRELGGWALQVRFSCGGDDRGALHMEGQFYALEGGAVRGTIERLRLGDTERFIKLALSGSTATRIRGGGSLRLAVTQPIGRLHARLTTGEAIEGLTLRWNDLAAERTDPSGELTRHPDNGTSVLHVVDDTEPMRRALATLVRHAASGKTDLLSDKPLQGSALMRALLEEMPAGRR